VLNCQHHISWVRAVDGGLHQCILCFQVVTKKDVSPKLEDLPEECGRRWDAHEATRPAAAATAPVEAKAPAAKAPAAAAAMPATASPTATSTPAPAATRPAAAAGAAEEADAEDTRPTPAPIPRAPAPPRISVPPADPHPGS
jgi:hypothetical protein